MTALSRLVAEYETRVGRLMARGGPKPGRYTLRVPAATLAQIQEMAEFWQLTAQHAMEELFAATVAETHAEFRRRREREALQAVTEPCRTTVGAIVREMDREGLP